MSNIATKLRFGAAACAVASTVTFAPMPVAQAAPVVPAPAALGSSLASTACVLGVFNAANCAAGTATIGNFFYLGDVNPNPPPRTDILRFNPTPLFLLIPIIGVPLASWWNSLNVEVCIGGLGARIGGPYSAGTLSVSVGSGC
ncbi:hypothetical protein Mycsm_00933 [Mycobacterium sp. JS623]|nr:hypothetical protein Mycsm_00933 [Mycobacterium sp. JS623]